MTTPTATTTTTPPTTVSPQTQAAFGLACQLHLFNPDHHPRVLSDDDDYHATVSTVFREWHPIVFAYGFLYGLIREQVIDDPNHYHQDGSIHNFTPTTEWSKSVLLDLLFQLPTQRSLALGGDATPATVPAMLSELLPKIQDLLSLPDDSEINCHDFRLLATANKLELILQQLSDHITDTHGSAPPLISIPIPPLFTDFVPGCINGTCSLPSRFELEAFQSAMYSPDASEALLQLVDAHVSFTQTLQSTGHRAENQFWREIHIYPMIYHYSCFLSAVPDDPAFMTVLHNSFGNARDPEPSTEFRLHGSHQLLHDLATRVRASLPNDSFTAITYDRLLAPSSSTSSYH